MQDVNNREIGGWGGYVGTLCALAQLSYKPKTDQLFLKRWNDAGCYKHSWGQINPD